MGLWCGFGAASVGLRRGFFGATRAGVVSITIIKFCNVCALARATMQAWTVIGPRGRPRRSSPCPAAGAAIPRHVHTCGAAAPPLLTQRASSLLGPGGGGNNATGGGGNIATGRTGASDAGLIARFWLFEGSEQQLGTLLSATCNSSVAHHLAARASTKPRVLNSACRSWTSLDFAAIATSTLRCIVRLSAAGWLLYMTLRLLSSSGAALLLAFPRGCSWRVLRATPAVM